MKKQKLLGNWNSRCLNSVLHHQTNLLPVEVVRLFFSRSCTVTKLLELQALISLHFGEYSPLFSDQHTSSRQAWLPVLFKVLQFCSQRICKNNPYKLGKFHANNNNNIGIFVVDIVLVLVDDFEVELLRIVIFYGTGINSYKIYINGRWFCETKRPMLVSFSRVLRYCRSSQCVSNNSTLWSKNIHFC